MMERFDMKMRVQMFGKALTKMREGIGLSSSQLAERSGVCPPGSLLRLRTGRPRMTPLDCPRSASWATV